MINKKQIINQIEKKIQQIQLSIQNYEQELANHKSTIHSLVQQLTEIKNQTQKNIK